MARVWEHINWLNLSNLIGAVLGEVISVSYTHLDVYKRQVMTSLRRVTACGYTLDDAITLEKAKELSENGMLEEYLRPTESVFACYPLVKVTEAQAVRFKNGGGLMLSRTDVDDSSENGAYYRVYNSSDVFLGLGYVNKEKEELSVKKQF